MKINYTGRHDAFPPKQLAKLETKLQKIAKLVERKGEREAHVILTQERFLHKIEITFNAWEHSFVGVGSDRELECAANTALDKLEKQIVKLRTKWRDTSRRHKDKEATVSQVVAEPPAAKIQGQARKALAPAPSAKVDRKKVFRVNHGDGSSKPMTLEEAMLEMEASQDYLVYRDARTDRVTVLMRRPDGHFDLIES
ncbi:MAG TPA: HPF/RaiA family ribosome-associated protein [Bryobacteraceae bacterium]|jgi:putative sigma-54 modulation protein|nr:HPF/RaiA family ribosome-associated protein [Bryobacteraceae bacterium]